jgi:hypothetical protein
VKYDEIASMPQFWGYNNANHCSWMMRQMIAAGADDDAIFAALMAEGSGPERKLDPSEGSEEDWHTGMRYAIADMRAKAAAPDLHQELIDRATWKERKACPNWPNDGLPYDSPVFDPAEKVATMLGRFNRQLRQNGFWGMVGNMTRDDDVRQMRALAAVARRERGRDPDVLDLVERIANLAAEAAGHETVGYDVVGLQSAYYRVDAKDGYRESRALDVFQAILAGWTDDLDPYAMGGAAPSPAPPR